MKATVICSILITACAALATETVTYTYSPAGRLTAATYDSGDTNASTRLTYDANSGLTKRISTFSTDGDTLDDAWELAKFGDRDETDAGDPDNDGLANTNEFTFGSHPDLANTDSDSSDDYHEWVADTDPNNPDDWFRITSVSAYSPVTVFFESSALRNYTLLSRTNLTTGVWQPLIGPRPGVGGTDSMTNNVSTPAEFYKVRVELP